jgi:hypothetical protein
LLVVGVPWRVGWGAAIAVVGGCLLLLLLLLDAGTVQAELAMLRRRLLEGEMDLDLNIDFDQLSILIPINFS